METAPGEPGLGVSDEAVASVVATLREGGVAVLPTETVYGVFAAADSPTGVARLRDLLGRETGEAGGSRAPLCWHTPRAADLETLLEAIRSPGEGVPPLHDRLLRLAPGPITFVVELPGTVDVDSLEIPGVAVGKLGARAAKSGDDAGGTARSGEDAEPSVALVRVVDDAVFARVADAFGGAIVGDRLSASGWTGDDRSTAGAAEAAQDAGAAVLDAGRTREGDASSAVRLLERGGFRVEHAGALPERTIRDVAQRVVLFVCTGNTCRSPMAQGLAGWLLSAGPDGLQAGGGDELAPPAEGFPPVPTVVRSAGVAAAEGAHATDHAVEAMSEMGIDLASHRATALTAELAASADVVYAMTRSHLDALLRLEPSLADRAMLLDPGGDDIADPIGGPMSVYRECAKRMLGMIETRLDLRSGPGDAPTEV